MVIIYKKSLSKKGKASIYFACKIISQLDNSPSWREKSQQHQQQFLYNLM